MLNAFKEQLQRMASDPKDPFTDHIRKRVGIQRAPEAARVLRQMVLAMPHCAEIVSLWVNDTRQSEEQKRLLGFVLAYLYQPVDFINYEEKGLFGYLDDAYVAAAVLHRTWLSSDFENRKDLGKRASIVEQLPQWILIAREVMPWETKEIESMLDGVARGDFSAYYHLATGMQSLEQPLS